MMEILLYQTFDSFIIRHFHFRLSGIHCGQVLLLNTMPLVEISQF